MNAAELLELARTAIKIYLATGQIMPAPNNIPAALRAPGAVFVTLYTASGQLRGCRGTLTPVEPTLAEAIIKTAIISATDDPRFPPVTLPEVKDLQIKIDVLSPLEPVTGPEMLDEKVYGVVMQAGPRRAVLLPNIAVVQNVAHQLELVRRKAGIGPDQAVNLFRFTVTRYQADDPQA